MKRTIYLLATCLLMIASSGLEAQNVQISGVKGRFYNGVHSIEDFGYYTIYQAEKASKGMVEYNLEIYDLNLNSIANTPVKVTKNDFLLGADFNGEFFLFAFADARKGTNTYFTFDKQGKQIQKKTVSNSKSATAGTAAMYPARDGSGFYVTSSVKEKKWGFQIEKLDRDLKTLWSKTTTRAKGWVGLVSAESANGRLIVVSVEKNSLMSKKAYGKIITYDDNTGDQIYEYPLYNGEVSASPSSFLVEEDGSVVTCGMYFDGEKWTAKNSDGVFFLKLSPEGEKMTFNALDWDNGIQEALKATSRKVSIGSKPKVLFHEIVQGADGNYQVVAETFRKTVKAGTVLSMASNSNEPPPMGFTVMDFIIFNYDQSGQPTDINKIEKPYKSTLVAGGIAQQGGIALAGYMKRMKLFTYEFTTTIPSTGEKVIVYTNFENPKLGSGDPYLGITTIAQGEESRTRKIPLSKKFTSFASSSKELRSGAMPGPSGSICLYIYDRKAKTVSLALEPLSMD